MAVISAEEKTVVLTNAKALDYTRKAGMSFDMAFQEYSRVLGQAEIDKDDLIAAGLEWPEKALFDTYLLMLNDVHADRICAEGVYSTAKEALISGMSKAELYLTCLVLAAKWIMRKSKDRSFKASYKKITFNKSPLKVLKNIGILADLVEPMISFLGTYKPAKIAITPEYLELVRAEARDLVKIVSEEAGTATLRSQKVILQNKILTLCLDAQEDIVAYAEAAFVTNEEYFEEHYSNQARKKLYRASQKSEEQVIIEEEPEVIPDIIDEQTQEQEEVTAE